MKTLIKAALRLILLVAAFKLAFEFVGATATYIEVIVDGRAYPWYQYASAAMVYLVCIIILALFWIKADQMVRFIAGPIRGNELTINTSNVDFIAVAMVLFGFYLVVDGLLDFGYLYSYNFVLKEALHGSVPDESARETSYFVRFLLNIIIGLGLIMGKNGLKKTLKWFNDIGKKPEEP